MGEARESNWTPAVNEACSFPIFNTAFDGEDTHRSTLIELTSYHEIVEFVERNGIELPQLLQVAWAFLLRSYIGTDRPIFGYFTGQHPSPESHGVLCALDLEEDKEIVHLARSIVCWNDVLPRKEVKRLDTAVIWNYLDVAHSSSVCIEAQSQGDACSISLHYWTSFLSEEQALHVASMFSQTIVELVKQPRLSSINLCTAKTIRQLDKWNSGPPMNIESCVHDLVLEKCKEQPEAPAVSAWDGELTYHDLDNLSHRLAVHLAHHGVGPEKFVGLYFEKSKWTAVAMLGVMRAGGAFAFLDISLPRTRIQGMCKGLNVVLILSSRHLTADVTGLAPQVVPVDNEQLDLTPSLPDSSQQFSLLANPRNALFAQFTSGSTGIPKGVVINHLSYCSGQTAFAHYVGLNATSRVLQFASHAFDASVQEILTTLIVGGCICVASEKVRKWNLPLAVSQLRVNFLILTPTVARLLQPSDIASVKTLVLAGEPVLSSDIATWQCRVRLANMYGPAECCVSTTGYIITRGERESGIVGSGIGARCWITDAQDYQKLVPIGAVGELLIEGPILGRGYIGDPDRTNATFVPSPPWRSAFPDNVYGRMYRTGDLAQYVSHGTLRIIGRRDEQVKLHGQRLELSEVEHHMRDAFVVKQTVAGLVIPAESGGIPILTGFILSPEDSNAPTHEGIFASPCQKFRILAQAAMSKLSDRLPRYMVPSVMIPTKTIPTTRTGKTDRTQLRIEASKYTRAQLEEFSGVMVKKRTPVSQMENLLHRLIQEVLGVKDFGMDDNFFSLGGDSVLAMRLTKIARDDTGVDLSGEMIFRAPVLSDLAKLMRGSKNTANVAPFSLLTSPESKEHILQTALRICNLSAVQEIEDIYPCTPLQEGIMALSITSPVAKYVNRSVFQIPRAIDIEKLKYAWTMVLSRNQVLRTRIIQTGSDVAFQVVVRHSNLWHDADNLKSYIEQDERKGIQLGSPLIRLALILDNDRRYLVLTIHHTLYDGWSLPRTFQQVERAYYGIIPRSQPFRMFVDYFLKINIDEIKEFWQNELEGFSGPLFPQPPSGDHTYKPATLHKMSRFISVPQATKTLKYPLATMIELSWALTLSQYSGTDDIVFGSTLAGRNVAVGGIDEILGPTITTIPRRIKLDRSMQLGDVLRFIQERNAEYLNFGYLGLQRIAALGAGAATACRLQSLLIIQPFYDEDALTIFNNCMEELSTEIVDNYILALEVKLGKEDAVRLEVEYDAEIIADSFMSRILEQFCHNLNGVARSGNKLLSEMESVNHTDLQTLLTWNNHLPEAINCCVHDIINRKCWSQPQSPAVIAWDGKLSYEELERYSTMLAAHLQGLSVHPDTYVMVYVGKSLWTVVAILAVMKAGGAFVLVDPAQPLMRLRGICEDTQARIVITYGQYMSKATELNLQIVEIDKEYNWKSADMKLQLKGPAASPDDVVYAVFTSGSTGKPKGVAIQHHAFITSAMVHGGKQHITNHSRVLQLASFTFDASIAEILYPLVHGGCVCIPSESDSRNNLDQTINDFEITWATLTPSLARVLDPQKVKTLRTLALGGEAMTKLDVTMWADRVQLVNCYGPAECSVDATIQPSVNRDSDPSNIGRGAAAVSWIMDPNNPERLRPIGAPGELLVEGPILAKGYLGDPDKTSSAFIQYPEWLRRFRHDREGRLYRTGDLVQYSAQADGTLRYLGRIDNQVKLRGQRIELGEVEQHLSECFPEAKQIVVDLVTLADPGAHPVLAAFILLNDVVYSEDSIIVRASASFRLQTESAESALKSHLPIFMIPALFLPVSKIPLSPAGKTDRPQLRKSLSALSRKDLWAYCFSVPAKRHASSTEESVLQKAVSTVLKIPLDDIGMDDNFFHLGGDSISAMRLVGLLRKSAITITVVELFSHPRLDDLALIVRREANSSAPVPIAPFSLLGGYTRTDLINTAARECGVDRDAIEDIYPCTPMQEALMALSIKDQDVYVLKMAFDLPRNIDPDRLYLAWRVVFNANPILRTRIIAGCLGSNDSFQVILREKLQFSADLAPLWIAHGQPLCKFSISHNDDCVQLHLWLHHSLYDGSSLSNLLKQASEAYNGAELSIRPFNAFAKYVRDIDTAASKRFWAGEFQDLNATMFPPMQKRPNIPFSRKSVSHNIPLQHALESDFTLSTFIHLACSIVLGHYTASDDIVYGLTLSGRNAPVTGVEDLTGPTIATVPFRIELPAACTTKECLSQIQNRLTRMIPHEQTGLQKIRQINQETTAACNFQCHIIIQPADESPSKDKIFKEPPLEEDIYSNFASSPLVLIFTHSADKNKLKLTSNFDLSHLSSIEAEAFSHQLDHVFQQIFRDQNIPIKEIDVISPEDLARLSSYNMKAPQRVDRLIHDLVFESCRMQPTKIAIASWDGLFSYEELYASSSRLAQHFTSIGIRAHPVTVICMEKSRWTVLAILAVLQTGSACALIDPSHPRSRIQSIVDQSSARYAVVSPTTKHLMDSICENVVTISQSLLDTPEPGKSPIVQKVDPMDPAFIIFTSGSTGTPKGIVLEHQSIATGLRNLRACLNLDRPSRVLQFSSYAFDASLMEILGSLTSGSTLFIPSDLDRTSGLAGFINQHQVDWAFMTPSASNLLLPSEVPSLKTFALGGEPLTSTLVDWWSRNTSLINVYGPAECTFAAAVGKIPETGWLPGTIGPMVNGAGWITTPSDPGRLAAWGAIGELLIEGPILSREYIADPEKTAASFVHNPPWISRFRGPGETRLYRTGDLVQYTDDGLIKYVGRKDRQVKLNGQRIELEEIESHLRTCFPPHAAVIVELFVPLLANTRSQQLCAFICMTGSRSNVSSISDECSILASPDEAFHDLSQKAKQQLSLSLPQYMVPGTYIPLSSVPFTGTGKTNRRLLCELAASLDSNQLDSLSSQALPIKPPGTEMETTLIELWAELLDMAVDKIGASDSFLHIGGDSVLAMRLTAIARRRGLLLTVPTIFSYPVLSDMACQMTKADPDLKVNFQKPFSLLKESVEDIIEAVKQQCSVKREFIEDVYPCTPLQEGLISLSIRTPGAYLAHFSYRLAENVDIARFQKAWQDVANANPILRTRIIQAGSLLQVVVREKLSWISIDNVDSYVAGLSNKEMHLGEPILQLATNRSHPDGTRAFVLAIHHVLYDGWSLPMIMDQVKQAYEDHSVPTSQFNKFIGYVARSDVERNREYWRTQFQGSDSATFPPLPSFDYKPSTDMAINKSVRLRSLPGLTNATILQLTWALLISQYSAPTDVVFGLTLSGRNANLEGIESVTGPTITTVPLRFQFKPEESALQGLLRMQEQIVAMTSFEQFGLQNIRRLGGDAEAACQFQNLLVIQPSMTKRNDEFWVPVQEATDAGYFSTYALEVTCELSDTETNITFDFDQRVLGLQQAERMLSQFVHLVQMIQKDPGASISDAKSLNPHAQTEIMHWNGVLPEAMERCVHEGIKQQCLKSPDVLAVCAWDGNFTYKELDCLSLKLAVHLQAQGIGPEVFVPILAEKTRWVSVAILGVVRAGGAVVLLDPSVPFQRLEIIFQDVGAHIVVSSIECADVARQLAPTVVTVSQDLYSHGDSVASGLVQKVTHSNALYAIFTSGSTGKPKGIVIEHSAFHTSGLAQQKAMYLDSSTRTLQFASHMFDVSIADYLWTFLAGGCVCVASQSSLRNDLPGVMRELEINRVDLTPSVARVLCPEEIPTLKTILLGGEPLSQHDVQTWASKIQLVNGYGPSECSVCCVLADVNPDSDPSRIGKTFGVLSWIVDKDDHNKLVPIGAVGELVLEGHALARGYLNEPEKTAAAFIETSPLWHQGVRSNSRLYKSGDLVQYNADGSLRYIGRKDTQVKIRGQRVELGEIEHQIMQTSPTVQDVVVELIKPAQRAGTVLAAFVFDKTRAASEHEGDGDSALFLSSDPAHRERYQEAMLMLQKRLPSYMVPAIFIPLLYMPISPSGKADRRLLRGQAAALSKGEIEAYTAGNVAKRSPRAPAERSIQAVVAEVLHIDSSEIGLDDDFFRLGGDSIIAIRFVERARMSGFSFRVTDVFKSPKLSDLVLLIEDSRVEHECSKDALNEYLGFSRKEDFIHMLASEANFTFHPDEIVDVLPVSQSAERFLMQLPEYWVLNLEGLVERNQLQSACTALVERHAILRTVFISRGHALLQVVLSGINTHIHDYGTTPSLPEFVEKHRREDNISAPTLNNPVTQFAIAEDSNGKKVLIVRLSHAQFDGYCLHILWKDLKQLHEGVSLSPPTEYSAHMKQWMISQTEDAFTFWRKTLEGSTVSRIDNTMFHGTSNPQQDETQFITATQRIYPEQPPHEMTTATVVKAAWSFLLARLLNTQDVVFTQISNGRSNATPSTQDVVGPCLNFIPVRAKLKSSWTALDLMQFLQHQHRESLDYELLDFRQIVERSTCWPSGTTHQSNLVHQNIEPDLPFPFGDAQAQVTCSYEWPRPPDDILIESRPVEDGGLQIALDTLSGILNQQNADWVVERLCRIICLFSASPDESLERTIKFGRLEERPCTWNTEREFALGASRGGFASQSGLGSWLAVLDRARHSRLQYEQMGGEIRKLTEAHENHETMGADIGMGWFCATATYQAQLDTMIGSWAIFGGLFGALAPIVRPSSGNRIAIMFPSSSSEGPTGNMAPYSLFFKDIESGTTAVFRIDDATTLNLFRQSKDVDIRIEKHGDLTSTSNLTTPPLHQFLVSPESRTGLQGTDLEAQLPERMDLDVSDVGIVGRKVTVSVGGQRMGMGIVGFD
ncbi:acetyl-CoA synthetase-like protein [Aspergillus affinis]|uniref:acetyl-CoA synthetase-like protein n=1 Tax=Aspergillus affinis TaxID=1070780 RepID=UPI0022FEF252|nr:acetyl-CoA synthetase-like protein [Aspergillus affinis]KAI9038003.1 acetyl-CoA synthetase-like protein [Aspergillus affinis]